VCTEAAPWLRSLITGLSLWKPWSVHVEFVVDKVALGQVLLWVLQFSRQYHSTEAVHTHILSGRWIGPLVATVQRHSLIPSTWTATTTTVHTYTLYTVKCDSTLSCSPPPPHSLSLTRHICMSLAYCVPAYRTLYYNKFLILLQETKLNLTSCLNN
jgi:hypothetical protein